MKKLVEYRFVILFFVLVSLEVIALLLSPSWYDHWTIGNMVLFIIVSCLAISQIFGKNHMVGAIIWSILVFGPLRWFFGTIEVALYWFLFSKRKKSSSTSTSSDNPTDRDSVPTSGIITKCGRIPFVRIPIPWLKYSLDLDTNIFTRDTPFAEKASRNKKGHRDFIGKDNDLPLVQVFDWDFSSSFYRMLAGTTCFGFQSKKIGREGDKKIHWHYIPQEFVPILRTRLRKLNK